MKAIAIIIAAALTSSPAIAQSAPEAHGPNGPSCQTIIKFKADLDNSFHLYPLTPGQFHFVEGVYVASPNMPTGLPPGNGAMLLKHDGNKNGIIVWTLGKMVCNPIVITERLVKVIESIPTGALDPDGLEI